MARREFNGALDFGRKLLATSVVVILATACTGSDPQPPDGGMIDLCRDASAGASTDLRMEIGTGIGEFVALADGDPVEVIFGAQGGYHIWTAVLVWGIGTDEPVRIRLTARLEAGGTAVGPASEPRVLLGSPNAEGARARSGLFNFIDDPEVIRSKRTILRAEVSACGMSGADERVVTPQ